MKEKKNQTQCIFDAFWDNLAKILCEHITRLNNKRFSCSSNEQRALCGDCLISAHQFRKVRYCYLKHKTKTKFQMYWTNNWNGTSTHSTNLHYKKNEEKLTKPLATWLSAKRICWNSIKHTAHTTLKHHISLFELLNIWLELLCWLEMRREFNTQRATHHHHNNNNTLVIKDVLCFAFCFYDHLV